MPQNEFHPTGSFIASAIRTCWWRATATGDWCGHRLVALLLLQIFAPALWSHQLIVSTPFAPRSGPRAATLFTALRPAETGITTRNTYADPSMWGDRYDLFALGSTGTGVAVADYDGDGRPDIYVVNKCDGNRLYRNLGNFHFEDVTESAGVTEPSAAWNQAAAFADVNNDGLPDLYVTRIGAPNLLFDNVGHGHFVERAAALGLAVTDSSGMAAFCDYDRDGWLDLYLQTNLLDLQTHPEGQRDHLFHNHGDGTFEEVTTAAGIFGETHGHSVTWWDYNNDGWPDIYVANDFSAPDQLYRNNGDGTFTDVLAQTVPHGALYAMGSDLGDVNNDGLIDLFVADMQPTTHEKDHRTMIEFRGIIPDLPDPNLPAQMARNALYLNTGTERCLEAAYLAGVAATDWTWSVRFEDLDNDGRLDLFATNGMVRDYFDSDLRERIAGWSPGERRRAVKAMPVLREGNLVFRNMGDLHFKNESASWGLGQVGVSFGAAFGDFDGDGDLDLIFINYEGEPTVCRNDSDSGHRIIVELRGTISNRAGVGATVRIETDAGPQVRQLVLARGYMSSSEPVMHFGLGDAGLVRRLTVIWPTGVEQAFENLPPDRRYTITEAAGPGRPATPVASSRATGNFSEMSEPWGLALISTEPPVDEFKREPLLPFRQNRLGPGVAIGDLDGDGKDDVVLGGATGESAQIFLKGESGFQAPLGLARTKGAADAALLIFDADGDGHDDLLQTKGGAALPSNDPGYQPQLFFSRGGHRFRQAPAGTLPVFTESAGAAVAADFNGDGRLDVFVGGRVVPGRYGMVPRSAIWINQGGTFVDQTTEMAPLLAHAGMVSAALATDVDRDGWPDLLLALQWGEVVCWHNRQGKRFEDWTERLGFAGAGSGWWNSIAAADFNGDGRLDYVVGNLGLNTPYHATPEAPAMLYRGPFGQYGRQQLIEGVFENGVEYPRRGRTTLVRAIPGLARKFPSFAGFASASLENIFGREALRQATTLRATEFRSGVFLSQTDGTFRFSPLPQIAQIAPLYGVVAGDFDGDGCADICAVQNSYAPIPETGRFDGGLGQFLRGDGRGGFTAVPARESGLLVTGDGKGLAVCDVDGDGWPDLIATRNNSSVLAFHHQPGRAGHMFAVVLQGSAQNAHGIGARVEVVMTDGRMQAAEISAGGGYLSQSTSGCFFGYTEKNLPREIRVTWPTGEYSAQNWTERAKVIYFSSGKSMQNSTQ